MAYPSMLYAKKLAAGAATLIAGKANIHSIILSPDGANAASVTLRDGGGSGTIKYEATAPATAPAPLNLGEGYIHFGTDVHVTVTGAGSNVTVVYSEPAP